MSTALDARFESAAQRFHAFFAELERTFVERGDLLAQVALALLSREHVLMTGPPGTAKSQLTTAVLGRIVDEDTGRPSLFARQFTESTVHTDLVGPIDFKTLMSTGRTEHFTDQGMLGAVHAFLDEVFDGRDMLLRTTLNVLHERELREGTKTTRGRIECALMTSNRYLAEVLEGSRETLLAFVDRVAFVSFVPKGFALSENLQRVLVAQVGGVRPPALSALLTIQDLDALQAAVDAVRVPDALCVTLGQLVEHMDADLAQAARADPTFLPTRYLSTRTAVRLGRVLRAACVYDRVMRTPTRPLVATWDDLPTLRLSLLLSGPAREHVDALMARESDARERRQLSILRTERDIFERALSRLSRPPEHAQSPAQAEVARVEEGVRTAKEGDTTTLLTAAEKLAAVADAGRDGAVEALAALDDTVARLSQEAARAGWTAGVADDVAALATATELGRLADGLERTRATSRPLARWLRGRAIAVLDDALRLAPAPTGALLDAGGLDLAAVTERANATIARADALREQRERLRAQGAEVPDAGASQRAIEHAAARLEDELVALWDEGLREAMRALVRYTDGDQLGVLLRELAPVLAALDATAARLVPWGRARGELKARAVGPRVVPLVEAAFARLDARDRFALVRNVEALLDVLDKAALGGAVPPGQLLAMCAKALARSEHAPAVRVTPDHDGYRRLRASEHRVPMAYTIAELASRVVGATADPDAARHALGTSVQGLDAPLRAELAAMDLARVRRALAHLDAWWNALSHGLDVDLARHELPALTRRADALRESRFFHVVCDEGALARFALECRVVAEVFPEAADDAKALRAAVETLDLRVQEALHALRRTHADLRWAELLKSPAT